MDGMFRWAIFLHVSIFALLVPMCAAEYSTFKNRRFSWKGFAQGKPKWVVPSIQLLGLFFALHFVLFLVQSHAASPEIKNGLYVLSSHGKVVKLLSQSEYLSLKGAELRLFATGWIFFYFVLMAYWWFPSSRQPLAGSAPE
jgi:hypothetical protein